MPETRRFAQGLKRKSMAGKIRENGSVGMRNSTYSGFEWISSAASEPVDYEAFVHKRAQEINHDPLRNLLSFPNDDFSVLQEKREKRTEVDTVPTGASAEASSLMVKECINTYTSDWSLVTKKYEKYAGDYTQLPKRSDDVGPVLHEQVFELDEQAEVEDDMSLQQKEGVTRRGWLYKAPAYGVSGIQIRSLKRRYFDLKQLPDNSYILNFYKDEKVGKDPKGAIYLDSCVDAHPVAPNAKTRKHAFEVRMQDHTAHVFAADSDAEQADWISAINLALQNTIDAHSRDIGKIDARGAGGEGAGDGGLEKPKTTMHPELMKYAKETDHKNSLARKLDRCDVFHLHPDFQDRYLKETRPVHDEVEPPPTLPPTKHRVMVGCKSISFSLRGVVQDGAEEPITNVEPFFVTLALYDAAAGEKVSADLHVDLNHPIVRRMIPEKPAKPPTPSSMAGKRGSTQSSSTQDELSCSADETAKIGEPVLRMVDTQWIAHPKQGIFSVTRPHGEIYLVARIEKVLQGSIKSCVQPYMKSDADNTKTAAKVLKHAKTACQRLGQYRMPFAWTARPLFDSECGLVISAGFDYVFKQESSKLSDEDLLKFLGDFRKTEKLSKLEYIDCSFHVGIDSVPTDLPNILTSSLVPVKPYAHKSPGGTGAPGKSPLITSPDPILEVDEFMTSKPELQHANMEYSNHCYIYPKSLNYDNQKTFAKARNIAVVAEFRDGDSQLPQDGSGGLRSLYKRPGPPGTGPFTTRASAAVLHHHERPVFYEEWKLSLPTQLHHGHHLLFSFYHVIVDTNAKKKEAIHLEVGHAWVPLLTKDGHVTCGEYRLPVAANLQAGYLSAHDQLAMGKHAGELKWVDGGKPLFHVNLRLVSSIYTQDHHLHNFFESCHRFHNNQVKDQDFVKYLKCLLAADKSCLVRFLPTILNQLLYLLTSEQVTSDAQTNCMHTLVHVVATAHDCGHGRLLQQYIKYMFVTARWKDYKSKTVHEEVVTSMCSILRPSTADFLTANKLLKYSSYFLQIVVKSVAQHLVSTHKIRQKRCDRFPLSFNHAVQTLVSNFASDIVKKWQTNYPDVHNANLSLANFVKDCFTYLDRGFVFKLIKLYMDNFNHTDPKVLFELKFEFFRVICNHEHYIPLNLPFACSAKSEYSYSMSDEYCQQHFVTGLLLKHLCTALYLAPDIRCIAIGTFRNVLAKHVFDDRYQTEEHRKRIAALYLPFLRILLDNVARISSDFDPSREKSSRDDLHEISTPNRSVVDSVASLSTGVSMGDRAGSMRSRTPDISLMNAISNPGSSLLTRNSRHSMAVASNSGSSSEHVTTHSPAMRKSSTDDKAGTMSIASAQTQLVAGGGERFEASEVRSLLLCFVHVLDSLPPDALLGFWKDSTTTEQVDFFDVLEMCMQHFRYTGKKSNSSSRPSTLSKKFSSKSKTLPVRIRSSVQSPYNKHVSILPESAVARAIAGGAQAMDEDELQRATLLEANLSTQVGLVVLDMVAEFARHYKKQLQTNDGDNKLMHKMIDLMLLFLQISQSEKVLKHAFASLRLVLCKMIKAVSQLISEEIGIGSSRFQHSLSVINTYAISDKGMQAAMCYVHIAALIAEHLRRRNYYDTSSDVNNYDGLTPAFVSSIGLSDHIGNARTYRRAGDASNPAFSENVIAKGCAAFRTISPNVEKEESAMKEDGMQDVPYNEGVLTEVLHKCTDLMQKAERYEILAPLFAMIIPFYERRRDYDALVSIYGTLRSGYEKVTEVNRNGKRLLGTYFRIALYGQLHFLDEDCKQYIYKEPKLTQLSEISQRLQHMYGKKFGAENVRLIQESGKVNRKELDPKLAYIQVTYVQPYFDEQEAEQRVTYFEQHNNVKNFCYETPFTPSGKARGDIEEQWKRKTILTTSHSFPYVKKRIAVTAMRSFELKPIEVALDEMTLKCNELEQLVDSDRPDLKKLQLRLQGSISVQVNAGPLAYAKTFLEDSKVALHAANTVERLRAVFRRFIDLCRRALNINEQMITANQQVYHESLQQCLVSMADELSLIMHEQLLVDDDDTISVITGNFDVESAYGQSATPKRTISGSVSDASVA